MGRERQQIGTNAHMFTVGIDRFKRPPVGIHTERNRTVGGGISLFSFSQQHPAAKRESLSLGHTRTRAHSVNDNHDA